MYWGGLHGSLAVLCLFLTISVSELRAEGNEKLETSVAGLQIKGPKHFDKLTLSDLDIVVANDTTRGIPLRRLLTATGLWSKEVGDTLFFRDALGRECWLAAAAKVIKCSGDAKAVAVRHGVSDVTGQLDFYLPEATIDTIFNTQLTWDEAKYSYSGTTTSTYPVWKASAVASERKRNIRTSIQQVGIELPEIMPPAEPGELGDPSIHFIQPGLTVNRISTGDLTIQKTVEAHGRLAAGRWGLRARQLGREMNSKVTVDEATLTHRLGDFESTIGDVDFGVNDLVFPHLRMTGWEFNGLAGLDSASRDDDRSNFGRSERYLSETDIHGSAPLGSRVELYMGDRFIDEQKVTEPRGAAGEGIYRFTGINLARDRVNPIRTVITEPDGKVTELNEERVGASSLLQQGQTAVIGGVGTHRFTTQDLWSTQGRFYGGRVLYGVTPYWSVALSGAYQNMFSLPYLRSEIDTVHLGLTDPFPSSSYHAGFENRVMFFRRHLLTMDLAWCRTDFDGLYGHSSGSQTPSDNSPSVPRQTPAHLLTVNPDVELAGSAGTATHSPVANGAAGDSAFAARAKLDIYISDQLKLQPMVFRYDPGYFDGTNPAVQDRQGYVMTGRVLWGGLALNAMHGEVQNNIRGKLAATKWESWQHLDFNVPRVIPRTTMRIGMDQLNAWQRPSVTASGDVFDGGPWRMGTVSMNSSPLRHVDLLGQFTAGDKLDEGTITDLRRGLGLPYSSSAFQRGWNLTAGFQLMTNGRLTIGHDVSPYRQRSSVAHVLRATDESPWQWRAEGGYDWDVRKPYMQVQPEYYLDGSGFNRFSGMVRYQRKSWMFSVGVQFQPIMSFVGGHPFLLSRNRVIPNNGGVKGVVFMDENGNGKRDEGEPGVPNMKVVAEGGRRTETGPHGEFVIGGMSSKRRMRISLDPRALPATYNATNGVQWANIEPGTFTPVMLGVVEPGSISGFVIAPDPLDSTKEHGLSGVRVIARDSTGATKSESITFSDGSFYLGSLLPGDYIVDVDPVTIAKGFKRIAASDMQRIRAGNRGNKLDLSGVTLHLSYDRSALEGDKKKQK